MRQPPGKVALHRQTDGSAPSISKVAVMTRSMRHGAVAAFREQLRGRLVSPSDAGYDQARRVWNGRIDRRPDFVAFCANEGTLSPPCVSRESTNCWWRFVAA